MHPARYGIQAGVALGLALTTLGAGAQARKISEYRLHEQADRGAPFGMTLGPDHTLYTIIPRRDGNWVLSEVKNWWQSKPEEVGILVEGFSNREPVADFGPMTLAVTPDGQTLVSVLSANMRVGPDDPYPTEMVVELIRLQDFAVLDTEHMRSLGMRGHLSGGLDRTGHLLIRSEIAAASGSPPFVTWFSLTVPEMKAQLVCSYQGSDPQSAESSCSDFARKEGYASAAELAARVWPVPPQNPTPLPGGVSVAPKDRWQSANVTIDGKPLTLVVVNGVNVEVFAAE